MITGTLGVPAPNGGLDRQRGSEGHRTAPVALATGAVLGGLVARLIGVGVDPRDPPYPV